MESQMSDSHNSTHYAHIIVFGNEKGGSGKSTAAMHVAIGLLRLGYKVGTIDLDARQGTLTRIMKNRWNYIHKHQIALPDPLHMMIDKSNEATREAQEAQERAFLDMALAEQREACDFIVIDTPGTDSHLSRLAHGVADTLITPVNDSLIDLDLIADIEPDTHTILGPSIYTKMVREQQAIKASAPAPFNAPMHWIVMRNRRSHLAMKHKDEVADILRRASAEFGFTYLQGFGERVIFRELFLKGLTLLDLRHSAEKRGSLTLSEVSARQEVRSLLNAINPVKHKGYRNHTV